MEKVTGCNEKEQNKNKADVENYKKSTCKMLESMKAEDIKRVYELTRHLWCNH